MRAPVPARARHGLAIYLIASVLSAAIAFTAGHARTHIVLAPAPSAEISKAAIQTLRAGVRGEALPEVSEAFESYEASGPIVVYAGREGRLLTRVVRSGRLLDATRSAAEAIAADPALAPYRARMDFFLAIEVGLGTGRFARLVPKDFSLVPLVEGLATTKGDASYVVAPVDLFVSTGYEGALDTGIPDFKVGVKLESVAAALATWSERSVDALLGADDLARVHFHRIGEMPYPRTIETVDVDALKLGANAGAAFLRTNQLPGGMYAYLFDPVRGRAETSTWNIVRHAGTAYFMAQHGRILGDARSRASARAAIDLLLTQFTRVCGAPDRLCVSAEPDKAMVGASALTAVAVAEILRSERDANYETVLRGLTAFLHAQMRPDGVMMHVFDLVKNEPVDVQLAYYSGEAALALIMAHEVLGDARDLEVARTLLRGLVDGWKFPFHRFYYGEEHWTCIAAGEARDRIHDAELDRFCFDWLRYSDDLQFREGDSRWPIEGFYGAVSMLLPNLAPIASRGEAFASTYRLMRARGEDTELARAYLTRANRALLSWSFVPGPVEILGRPTNSFGGVPASPSNLMVRNDFVQHAGSSLLRWLEIVREEEGGSAPVLPRDRAEAPRPVVSEPAPTDASTGSSTERTTDD